MTILGRPMSRFARQKWRVPRLQILAAWLVAASAVLACPATSFAQPGAPAAKSNPYVAQRFLVAAMVGMALFVILRSSRREKEVKPLDDTPTV